MKNNCAVGGDTGNSWFAPGHNLNTSKALRKLRKAVKRAMQDGWEYEVGKYIVYEDVYAAIEKYYKQKIDNENKL